MKKTLLLSTIFALCLLSACAPKTHIGPGASETNRALITRHPVYDPDVFHNEIIKFVTLDGIPVEEDVAQLMVAPGKHVVEIKYGSKQHVNTTATYKGYETVATYKTWTKDVPIVAKSGQKYELSVRANFYGDDSLDLTVDAKESILEE